ncbi:hypothetical protein V493_02185 [Pseudogymnoascus sp. VKM F-4281 (FW-2241)]|nr:hypothetical protein V493_02185 [Pseudogymnoascus sp. VKM F-4281 (FW-2241)]
MDDHRSRKRRRHDRQEESTERYATERRRPALPADIGCDTPPARRRGRDAAAAETRVRSHIKVPENGYVYKWLAEVATEQPQTHSPANDFSLPLTQTRGFRHTSPGRYDETVPDERTHREKKRDSSDSSLVQPAYEREGLPQRDTTIGQATSDDQTIHVSKKVEKNKQLVASATTDDSQSESDQPQRKETFEKRSRHKTKEDHYESKKARKHVVEDDRPAKKNTVKVKRGDAAKASRKAGEDLINGFRSKNVAQDRLTMRPGTGIFRNGRASSPSRNRGLPDLAFSEMQFLKQSNRKPPESENDVIVSKSGQKTKLERERARNEISNYFIPVRQPLQETGINHGREASTLPSDAGKTEATSVVGGYYSRPPVSREHGQNNQKELNLGFGTGMSTPQAFSLPKPKLDHIFISRPATEKHNASSKLASYCTWSESGKSPGVHAIVADAPRNRRCTSPTSRQRIPLRAGMYKEAGIQAELDSEVDSPYNATVQRPRRIDEGTQVVMSKQLKIANVLSALDANDENRSECQDDDSIYQLQANRAVFHDCEPHIRFERAGKDNLEKRPEPLRTKTPAGSNQDAINTKQTTVEQCTQTGLGAFGQSEDTFAQPGQTNLDSEVHSIMSRAVLAEQAYIKRRPTPKVAVEKVGGNPDVRVLPIDVPSTGDSGTLKEDSESRITTVRRENEACHPESGAADGWQNEVNSQSGQDRFPIHGSNLPDYEQTQSEYIDAAWYQPNELDDNRGYGAGEHRSHQIENIATHGHAEPPQLMIPTRGFSTSTVHLPPGQPRTISPLETMELIYARQLQSQAFDAQEEQRELYNQDERGGSSIYLYEGGQWEREPLDVEAVQEYNPIDLADEQANYGDIYEEQQDGLDVVDESMYYGEELPFDSETQTRHAATADNMLFYTPARDSSVGGEYPWMPRGRRYFGDAANANQPELGSWERVQAAVVPQELTMQFWRPRRGY